MAKLPLVQSFSATNVRVRQLFQKVKIPSSLLETEPLLSGELSLKSSKLTLSSSNQVRLPKPKRQVVISSTSLSRLQTKRREHSQPNERSTQLQPLIKPPLPLFPHSKQTIRLPPRRPRHKKKQAVVSIDDSIQITQILIDKPIKPIHRPGTRQGHAAVDSSEVPRMLRPRLRTKTAPDEAVPRKPFIRKDWAFMQEDL
jgi:hypothetical protein